eukprot:s2247_g1.t1
MQAPTCWGWLRSRARRFSQSTCSTQFMALIDFIWLGSLCCLFWYTFEMIVMIMGRGKMVLKDAMFLVDIGSLASCKWRQ